MTVIEHASECAAVHAGLAGQPIAVLGGGSNVLCATSNMSHVLQIAIQGIDLVRQTDEAHYVKVGAGESWHGVVLHTLAQGWAGLENLALIPGWAGAAPVQNIGAYGVELADRLHSVAAWDMQTASHVEIECADCQFGYRDSVFKRQAGRYWITALTLRLPRPWRAVLDYADLAALKTENPSPQNICDAVVAIRSRKLPDPATIPNAGSFFKNPVVSAALVAELKAAHPTLPAYPQPDGTVKLAAGWLIEQCGWKGHRAAHAPVGVHAAQALVLVHDIYSAQGVQASASQTAAKGADLLALAEAIQSSVRERFRVELQHEVNVWR